MVSMIFSMLCLRCAWQYFLTQSTRGESFTKTTKFKNTKSPAISGTFLRVLSS
jgi:hypothetical protein